MAAQVVVISFHINQICNLNITLSMMYVGKHFASFSYRFLIISRWKGIIEYIYYICLFAQL